MKKDWDRMELLAEAVLERRVCDYLKAVPSEKQIPWTVGRLFDIKLWFFAGEEVSTDKGDYANLEEWQRAIEYLAGQFGGLVVWEEASNEESENELEA